MEGEKGGGRKEQDSDGKLAEGSKVSELAGLGCSCLLLLDYSYLLSYN